VAGRPGDRVEAMLLPRWAPFHVDKVSYWSRTVMVPLFVLAALKPRARNPRRVDVARAVRRAARAAQGLPDQSHGPLARQRAPGAGSGCAGGRAAVSELSAAKAIDKAMAFVQEAAQRRRRSWRHFSGHGQCGDGLRCAGLAAGSPGGGDRTAGDRQAASAFARARDIASRASLRSGIRLSPCIPCRRQVWTAPIRW
jgi:hypothetical protein